MKDVTKLLEEDKSYNHNNLAQSFFGKSQVKERKAYESGAKIYYELGFREGQNECATIHQADNVDKEDYDFLMKLLSMMGLSYSYMMDIPLIQKEAYRKVIGQEPKMPFHPGLNLVQSDENHIPADKMKELKAIVNSIFDELRSHN